jgi:hypothetical protein
VALLLISFVATGSVFYQIRNRRPVKGTIVGAVPTPAAKRPNRNATAAASAASASLKAVATALGSSATGAAESTETPTVQERRIAANVPTNGWGRNPFLTIEEINKMNQPDLPVAVDTSKPKPQAEPATLPNYAVTGIISGGQGKWAIIDGRMLKPGERLGPELLKEVKDSAVVLEHQGQMRELPLRRLEDTAAAAPPKKESK